MCSCAYVFGENRARLRNNKPCAQPNTSWISADGNLYFTVEKKYTSEGDVYISCPGVIIVDGISDSVNFVFGAGPEIDIFPLEHCVENRITTSKYLEHWIGDFEHPDRFTAKVKTSTYFNEGDKIEFYRIDEEQLQ